MVMENGEMTKKLKGDIENYFFLIAGIVIFVNAILNIFEITDFNIIQWVFQK